MLFEKACLESFMTYLFVFVFLSFLGVYFYYHPNSKFYLFAKFAAFVIFVYLAGMRYELGVDYFAYAHHFENYINLTDLFQNGWPRTSYEPGFVLFMIVLRSVFDNPQFLFFSASLICSILLFYSLTQLTERRMFFLSVLVYFSFVYLLLEMHALRQAMAASVSYLAWVFMAKNKNVKALLFIFLAMQFHSSATFLLPIYLFLNRSINLKIQAILLSVSTIVMVLQFKWIDFFVRLLENLVPFMASVIKLAIYTNTEQHSRSVFLLYFIYLFVYIYMLYKRRVVNENSVDVSPSVTLFEKLFFFFLIVTSLFWEINYLSIRLGWYLLFGFVLLFPYMTSNLKLLNPSYMLVFVILLCFYPTRHFIFPNEETAQFSPYEDYIQCKILDLECSGRNRADQYIYSVGGHFLFY